MYVGTTTGLYNGVRFVVGLLKGGNMTFLILHCDGKPIRLNFNRILSYSDAGDKCLIQMASGGVITVDEMAQDIDVMVREA